MSFKSAILTTAITFALSAVTASAHNPLEPIELSDIAPKSINRNSSHTYHIPDSAIAFEVNISFPSNCYVTLETDDSIKIVAHLSDKVVNSDILSDPFYRFDIYSKNTRIASEEYNLNGKSNNFVALKISNGKLLVGNRQLEKELTLNTFLLPDYLTIKSSKPSTIKRSIITLPPQLPEIYNGITSADDIPLSSDKRQGLWRMIDEVTDTKYGVPGGNYLLATIANGDTIKLHYMDGAEIYPDVWKPGMIKGVATLGVDGISYDLKWIDAEFNTDLIRPFLKFENDCMILSFPYDHTVLTFMKIK